MSNYRGPDSGTPAAVWLIGWLFTIGFAHLTVKKALLGIVLWAYFLGEKLAR
ncbi:MAG TPA: hypothetical protein VFH88_01830 [Candidatus Krumholzibacteria bacterium]|nr:hypothetical protein [Candidatus Krumholzibacteria bacterium]